MAPSLDDIQAVGSNGIPLNPCVALDITLSLVLIVYSRGAFEPLLYVHS